MLVTNEATGRAQSVTTSALGGYEVDDLLVGAYTISASAPRFHTYTRQQVQVNAAQVTDVSLVLRPAGPAESITVPAGADVTQKESSQLSYTFSGSLLTDVPTIFSANDFGSVQNLAVYLPHTTSQLGGTSGNGGSIGGLRGRQNMFAIDGALNTDLQSSTSSFETIQDAVAEFSLATNQFSAEYGGASGGQFNVVTRSGGNKLHGGVWWYGSNRHLNAASAQEKQLIAQGVQNEKSRFDYSRPGVRLGGPIVKRRLFFFGAYEHQSTRLQAGVPSILAPTADGLRMLRQISADDAVRGLLQQFPVAPVQESTAAVMAMGNTYSIPIGTAIAVAPNYLEEHSYITNLDFGQGAHQLHFRHLANWIQQPNQGAFPQPVFDSKESVHSQKAVLEHVWSGRQFVQDFRFSFGRLAAASPLEKMAANYPTIFIAELGALIGPAGNLPQERTTNLYEASDSVTYASGRSVWKFGGGYSWTTSHSNFLPNSRGQQAYQTLSRLVNDQVPDVAGATFLGIGSGDFVANTGSYSIFAQNDLKLTPRLTLNLGIRYDLFGLPRDAEENAQNATSDCPSCITPLGIPLVFRKPKNDRNNLAPRLGFAWDPTGTGKWAIRGGGGLAYDVVPYSFYSTSIPPQKRATLTPNSSCAGIFGAPPVWCPAFLAGQPGSGYLAAGGMSTTFVPPSSQAETRGLTAFLMPDNTSPQVYHWSFGVQRELTLNTGLEVTYLGTRGLRLPVQTQLNSISIFERGFPGLPTYFELSDVPRNVSTDAPTRAQAVSLEGPRFAGEGFFSPITAYPAIGASRYQGLSLDLNRRFSGGLIFRFNATFSSAKDDSTNDSFTSSVDPRRAEDPFHLKREWGRSVMDVGRKFALTWVYEIPTPDQPNRFVRSLLKDWEWSGSYLWQGGQPVTILSGVDSNGNLDSAGDRAILNPKGIGRTGTATSRVCRDAVTGMTSINNACPDSNTVGYLANDPTASYVQTQLGSRSDIGRNTVSSEPLNIWNLALFRNVKFAEGKSLQLQAVFFDALNQRNFALAPASIFAVNDNALSTAYTNVTSQNFLNAKQFSGNARVIQLGARVFF